MESNRCIKTTEEVVLKPIPDTTLFNECRVTRYHVRLGTKYPQIYSTDLKCTDIRLEKADGTSTPVTASELATKPWILKNLQQEVTFQRKKERAEMFSKDCFQRTRYSANQRIAYNNARHN